MYKRRRRVRVVISTQEVCNACGDNYTDITRYPRITIMRFNFFFFTVVIITHMCVRDKNAFQSFIISDKKECDDCNRKCSNKLLKKKTIT